ncbi:acyl-CoA dehydrogenase family protein [Flavimarina sp. Hel_I_48]|uniref:acyl-CoA dehydrogenase family protein n=1 Tax=Flavimarina sp. Hel_I_48 TaxID=1392488 RepID=UPI0004DF2DE2|nr:acyl-CoA dehydrogenase family protein [Flavimarina sp. Hel_I_48]
MYITKKIAAEIEAAAPIEGKFPKEQLEILGKCGLMKAIIPEEYGGEGIGMLKNTAAFLNILKVIGTLDLSLGRIFEGHFNTLFIIALYGSEESKQYYFDKALKSEFFGVWNTDQFNDPVRMENKGNFHALKGKKIFCSGGRSIQNALISTFNGGVPQLLVVHLDDLDAGAEDTSSWNPMGMCSSVSTTINFDGYTLENIQLIGNPGDYFKEPYFNTGSVRFASVQLGGAFSMASSAISHLTSLGRHNDTIQKARIAQIAIALESGDQWIQKTGEIIDNKELEDNFKIHQANMLRCAILEICTEVMHLAERAVGLQGFMRSHKMEKLHRDLSVYLKQPGPDAALQRVGEWVFNEDLKYLSPEETV